MCRSCCYKTHSISEPCHYFLPVHLSVCQQTASQDVAFSSLFFKVVMQMLTWLESSALEAGPLSNLLKSLVAQYSHKHHITDGEAGLLPFVKQYGSRTVHESYYKYKIIFIYLFIFGCILLYVCNNFSNACSYDPGVSTYRVPAPGGGTHVQAGLRGGREGHHRLAKGWREMQCRA